MRRESPSLTYGEEEEREEMPIPVQHYASEMVPPRGIRVAQSVERLTSAQVMISQLVSSSPASGSVPTAQSLEPVSDSVSPSLSDPPPFVLCLSLSQK